jgi:hypothetical protein
MAEGNEYGSRTPSAGKLESSSKAHAAPIRPVLGKTPAYGTGCLGQTLQQLYAGNSTTVATNDPTRTQEPGKATSCAFHSSANPVS